MSIASNISRLQTAKASLKTSLNAKNDSNHQITTETIDEYPDFVDSITKTVDICEKTGTLSNTSSGSTSTITLTPDSGYTNFLGAGVTEVTANSFGISSVSNITVTENPSTHAVTIKGYVLANAGATVKAIWSK